MSEHQSPLFSVSFSPEEIHIIAQAVSHILGRISVSGPVGYYCGLGTETFDRLIDAQVILSRTHRLAVEEQFLPRHAADPTKELRNKVADLERQLSGRHEPPGCFFDRDEPCYGPHNLGATEIVDRVLLTLATESHHPERCVREIAGMFDAIDLPIALLAL